MRTGRLLPRGCIPARPWAALLLLCLLLLAAAAAAAPVISRVTPAPTPAIGPEETTAPPVLSPAPVPTRTTPPPATTTPVPVVTAASPVPRPVRTTATENPGETPEVETPGPTEEPERMETPEEMPVTVRSAMTVIAEETRDTHGVVVEPAEEGREGMGASEPFTQEEIMSAEGHAEVLSLLQEKDPAVQDLRGDNRSISVTFARQARVLGFFSLPYNETVTINRAGQVSTETPWWLGLAQPETGTTLQKQQQIIETLSNVAKLMGDEGIGNNTRKIG